MQEHICGATENYIKDYFSICNNIVQLGFGIYTAWQYRININLAYFKLWQMDDVYILFEKGHRGISLSVTY